LKTSENSRRLEHVNSNLFFKILATTGLAFAARRLTRCLVGRVDASANQRDKRTKTAIEASGAEQGYSLLERWLFFAEAIVAATV